MSRALTTLIALALLLGIGWGAYQWQHTGKPPWAPWLSASAESDGTRKAAGTVAVTAGGQGAARVGAGGPGAGKSGAGKPGAAPAQGGRPPARPTAVTVTKSVGRNIEDQVTAVGTLLAAQSVLIKPEIAGRIDSIRVADGQSVAAGDELFRLDRSVIEAEFAQARAELGLARANLKRTTNLASQAFVSERSRDEARSNVEVLEARLQVVQARLDKTRIRAPFDGVIGLLQVDLGDYVQAGTPLVRLDDLTSLKLDFRVPERLFSRLRRGQPIRVGFDAYPGRDFDAEVETIDARLDDGGRSVIIRGRIANDHRLLRPGMFARARLVLGQRVDAVMVPEAVIVPDAEGQFVYRVNDGKARRIPVRLGARQEGMVEVLEGLAIGDTVVLAGQINLRGAEAPVRIVADGESARAPAR
ncbi:MAG: efflux RND transporter periplasmic adaptor subunit [Burkholderiaceae bacterium]